MKNHTSQKKSITGWLGMVGKMAMLVLLLLLCRSINSQAAWSTSTLTNVYGADTATAVFSNPHSLVLDSTVALADYYVTNMSALGFATANDATIYFNNITDNLLSYEYNFATGEVVVNLHLQYADASWTVANWNSYIYSKLNP